jgi:LDH2 family malate/lactate/ureidoglycolate dehydrogenase
VSALNLLGARPALPSSAPIYLSAERLLQWVRDCLQACGVAPVDAACVADALVQTSLWGIDSHGVLRLTHYLNRIAHGSIDPQAVVSVMRTGPCTAQIDGRHGLGIVHAMRATDEAEKKKLADQMHARMYEIGTHVILGEYDQPMAARKNISGFFVTNGNLYWNLKKN